jgi:hypothetical protein
MSKQSNQHYDVRQHESKEQAISSAVRLQCHNTLPSQDNQLSYLDDCDDVFELVCEPPAAFE